MREPDMYLVFLERLNRGSVPYMVTGSVASIAYGEPRLTHDVDLVVELDADCIEDFVALFPADAFYCRPQQSFARRSRARRADISI